jgi:hypothetical protein
VDEELDRVHGPIKRAKEQRRPAPDCLDQLVPWGAISNSPPNSVRVSGQWGPYESGPAVGSPFTDHQVRGQIGGQPTLAQGGCVGTEVDKEVAEGRALLLSKGGWRHRRSLGKRAGVGAFRQAPSGLTAQLTLPAYVNLGP